MQGFRKKAKQIFSRNLTKRCLAWAAVLIIVTSSVLMVIETVMALQTPVITMSNIKADYDNAARAEHAALKIYQCASGYGGIWVNGTGWWDSYGGDGYNYDTVFNGKDNIFYYESLLSAVGLHSLSAGRWLETMVQGEFDDGMIDCGDKNGSTYDYIINVFAKLVGVKRENVICGENGAPGLLMNSDGGECSKDRNNTKTEYVKNPDWESHIAKLYDNYVSGKDYPVKWADLVSAGHEYTYVDSYYLYSLDIEKGCNGSLGVTASIDDEPSAAHMDVPLYRLDDWGNTTYEWFTGKGNKALSESGFVAKADGWTCDQYVARANDDELYGAFKTLIHDKIKEGCYESRKTQVEEGQANFDANKDNMSDEDIAADQAILDLANALLRDYEGGNKDALVEPYVDENGNPGNGGIMCKEIDGLSEVGMETYELDATDDDLQERAPSCYDGGGSLGWILCPLLEGIGDTVNFLYDEIIAPFLTIKTTIFNNDQDVGSYGAWSTFRNMANLVLIIFFVVIIFSQLTGIGIDNYGIKKSLPKIVVAAVLINLSYIICELAVDVSNILGYGLKNLMDSMADKVNIAAGEYTNGMSTGNTILTVIVGAITIGIAGLAIFQQGMFAVILAALIAVFSALVSLFFTFVLLGARQAGVVILVVLSPLAMVCYMLPNTKKLFDKWLKMFEGLLMLFPIVGLLIGGGNLASRILLSTGEGANSFFFALAAMLMNIIPFFFIPTLLKGSFAAMGNIGARLSGVRKGMTHRVGNMARNSEYARNKQQLHMENQRMHRAGLKYDKEGNLQLTKRGQRQNARVTSGKMRGAEAARLSAERAAISRSNSASARYAGKDEDVMARFRNDRMAQAQRDEREDVDDMMLALENDDMRVGDVYDANGKLVSQGVKVNMNDEKDMTKALTAALKGNGSQSRAQVKALTRALSAKGSSGRDAVRQAIDDAVSSGDAKTGNIQAASSTIMSEFAGAYKASNRTTFDFAQQHQGDSTVLDSSLKNDAGPSKDVSIGSLKASTIGDLDDKESERLETKYQDLKMTASGAGADADAAKQDLEMLGRTAYEALNGESGASIKASEKARLSTYAAHYHVETGRYKLANGANNNDYTIHKCGDGKFRDDGGHEVDISHFKRAND